MSLLTNESPLIILPSLALKLGTNEAIFLQQLHYWLGKTDNTYNGIKWAYNTIQQWADQLKIMSVATIERAVAKLKKLGVLLVEKLNPNKSDRTNFYSINYKKLAEIIRHETCQNQPIKLMQSPPQAEVIQYRKPKQTIPAKRGNVLTENTKDNQKNLTNGQGKHQQSSAVQSIIGTTEPTPAHSSSINCLWILVGFINSLGSNGWILAIMIHASASGLTQIRRQRFLGTLPLLDNAATRLMAGIRSSSLVSRPLAFA